MANVPVSQAIRERAEREEAQRRADMQRFAELMIEVAREYRATLELRPELPDVLTAAQVAELLRLNEKTFYDRHRKGLIPGCIVAKPARFSKRVILKWIDDGRPPATND